MWDIIAVCDVPDPRQRYCLHELVGERGKVSLDTPHYKTIILSFELVVQLLMQSVGDCSVMIWAEVTLFATCDLTR